MRSDDDEDQNRGDYSCFFGLIRTPTLRRKQNGIDDRRNGKKPVEEPEPEPRYFGVALNDLFNQFPERLSETADGLKCPTVAFHCVQYLRNMITLEGIFRVSGTWNEVNLLRANFEEGIIPDLGRIDNPHSVASLLDLYLRQLPDSLLTARLYDQFVQVGGKPEPERLEAIPPLLNQLPEAHLHLLKYILRFFRDISRHSDENKMNAKNLSIIFGPILLGGEDALSLLAIAKLKTQAVLIETMINYCDQLLPS